MRVGINGMGRIGRLALRAAMGGIYRPDDDPRAGNRLDVVHVNELKGGDRGDRASARIRQHARPLARNVIGVEDGQAIVHRQSPHRLQRARDSGRSRLGRSRLRRRARMHRQVPQAGAAAGAISTAASSA